MARRYKMTPARRAALKKAQAASARKRAARRKRKLIVKRTAYGAGVVGLTGLAGAAVYGHKLLSGGPRNAYPSSRALMPARARGNPLNEFAKTYDRKNKRWVSVPNKGVYKVKGGQFRPRATHVQRLRPAYDAKRRTAYAASRPKPQKKRKR